MRSLKIILFLVLVTSLFSQTDENKLVKEKQKSVEFIGSLNIANLHLLISNLNLCRENLENNVNLNQNIVSLNQIQTIIDYLKKDLQTFREGVTLGKIDEKFIENVSETLDSINEIVASLFELINNPSKNEFKKKVDEKLKTAQENLNKILKGD